MVEKPTTLTRADYEDYLVYLYFGSTEHALAVCINRAYQDFQRTLTGFGQLKNGENLREKAKNLLEASLCDLRSHSAAGSMTAGIFDAWHKTTCQDLISHYNVGSFHFYVGQAQKWINMTFKYIFTLGEKRAPGFGLVYPFCHVPFDTVLLGELESYGFPALSCAWSRLDNYDVYFHRQNWIRKRFSIAPMDVEFLLWLEKQAGTGHGHQHIRIQKYINKI